MSLLCTFVGGGGEGLFGPVSVTSLLDLHDCEKSNVKHILNTHLDGDMSSVRISASSFSCIAGDE